MAPSLRLSPAAVDLVATCAPVTPHLPLMEAAEHARFHLGMSSLVGRGWRGGVARVARDWGAIGITLGDQVYLRDAAGADDPGLVLHELVHVAQARVTPLAWFFVRYGLAYSQGRLAGLGDRAAYAAIDAEVEARKVEQVARSLRWPIPLLIPADPQRGAAT